MEYLKKLVKHITWKKGYFLSCGCYCLLMFPLLWISKYNHMCADDYGYGMAPHLTWLETGSVIGVIKEAVQVAVDYYDWWQGTYSSIFLMALQPGIFGESYYFLGALFLYIIFHVGFFYLTKIIFERLLGNDKYSSRIATFVILILLIQFMETPVQSFYFYNAGVHYIFMVSIMWIMMAMQVQTIITKEKRKLWFYCVAQVLLGILLGGGNYITAFFFVLTSVTFFVIAFLYKKRTALFCVPGFVFEVLGFVISAIAPGNAVRTERSDGVSAFRAILLSFKFSLEYLNEYVDFVVVLILLLFLPLAWKLTANSVGKFRFPILVIAYAYCLYAAMFSPTCYALGYPGAGRCRNVYVMFLYLYLIFVEIYVVGWLHGKIQIKQEAMIKPMAQGMATICIVILLVVLVQNPNQYMSLSAVKSMYYKEAQLYHVIHLERELQLKGEGETITVRHCPIRPHLLFFDDITSDANDWKNKAAANWYQKKEVIVE